MKHECIYLTIEEFDILLETELNIITEPTVRNRYYVCEHTDNNIKSIVHVFILL